METLSLIRLMQLASPTLPVGAYTYSQGLELVVSENIVTDESSAAAWIKDLLHGPVALFEAPVLACLYRAWLTNDLTSVLRLNREYLASRETSELRAETLQMGFSLKRLSSALLDVTLPGFLEIESEPAFPTVFSALAMAWSISCKDTLAGYLFSWCENQVVTAVKTVPLGQTAGQRLLVQLGTQLPAIAENAMTLPESEWSSGAPGFAIACCRHETQYSRLFRS